MAKEFKINITHRWWFHLYVYCVNTLTYLFNIEVNEDTYTYWQLKAMRLNGKRINLNER